MAHRPTQFSGLFQLLKKYVTFSNCHNWWNTEIYFIKFKITSEFIFDTASFKQCHASTIVELKDGSLLSAWFGGSYEGATDVSIWTSFYHKGKWTVPKIAAEGNENRVYPIGYAY